MRLFGRITRFIQISRCLGYHAPHFRPRSLIGANKLLQLCSTASSGGQSTNVVVLSSCSGPVQRYSQKSGNVFNITENVDMLRKRISFSGAPNTAAQILPVGLITPEAGDEKDLKIVIVPLNLSGMDANSLKETLEAINQLRMYAHHIEAFSSSMVDDYNALNEAFQEVSADKKQEQAKTEDTVSEEKDNAFFEDYTTADAVGTSNPAADAGLGASTPLQRQAAVGCLTSPSGNASQSPGAASSALKTTKSMSAMAQPSPNRSAAVEADLREAVQDGDIVEEVQVDVPQDLSDRLNDMAVSSMELSFEMDMTNLRDALSSKDTKAVSQQEPMICMHTKVEMDVPGTVEQTIPLRFNALISGVVELDAKKLSLNQLTDEQMPSFNDDLTSLAANLCSTALEKGFSAVAKDALISDLELANSEEALKTKAIDTSLMTPAVQVGHQREEMVAVADQPQANCAVPVEVPVPTDKDGCKNPPVKPKRKCPGKCPLIDDPCKENPCKRPAKKPKKAESTTEITAMAKGGDKKKGPCAQPKKKGGKDAKGGKGGKDAKGGKGGKGGKDGKKKKDPCAKFKKGAKKDPCAKKKDPCAEDKKKKDPCAAKKKKDPCAAKKKKKDPCAKDKKKKDPCAAKKKKDPCAAKKGKGKDAKKKDPCAKFKKAPAKKGGKDGKGGKGGKGGKCKKFSTFAKNQTPSKRYLSTALNRERGPRFLVYSTLMRRHYSAPVPKSPRSCPTQQLLCKADPPARFTINSAFMRRRFGGLTGKFSPGCLTPASTRSYAKKKSGGKCGNMQTKYPKSRGKDIKERTGLREDCFNTDSDGGCGIKSCTGKCSKVKFPKKKCDRSKKNKKGKKGKKGKKDRLLAQDAPVQLQLQHRSFGTRACVQRSPAHSGDPKSSVEGQAQAYALRISEAYKVNLVPVSKPSPRDFDVLIRTGSVAISGSDIHVYENGNRDVEAMSLGHDATGFVEEVGRSVHHLHVGDRVVVESALSCSICDLCKQGLYNMCAGLVYNGFLSTFQLHPADLCHRLHPSISMEEGALTQTLALGCQACFKGNITPTSNVLILGTCPTGVAAGICAQAMGAKQVTIAGCMGAALEVIARDFGFEAVEFDCNASFGEVLEAIHSKFQAWPNCVINCSISATSMNLAVMALQPCGVCVLAECDSECASFNALDVLMKNIRLIPSFRSANMYPTALQLMRSGRAPMKNFIRATYPLSQAEEAFRSAQHESNMGLGKIIVNCAEAASMEESRRNSE